MISAMAFRSSSSDDWPARWRRATICRASRSVLVKMSPLTLTRICSSSSTFWGGPPGPAGGLAGGVWAADGAAARAAKSKAMMDLRIGVFLPNPNLYST